MSPSPPNAAACYGDDAPAATEHRRAVVRRASRPLTPAVAAALAAQNARLPASATRRRSLDALRTGAAAVVTGQQVGLFLGPLFNVFKAASAVRTAAFLQEETGAPVVPVFWLQTEDHDLPEIAVHRTLDARTMPLALGIPCDPQDRRSVGDRQLPDEVAARLDDLQVALAELPHASDHLARLRRHYVAGARWSDAFAGVLAELFADTGLVFIDPRDATIAAELVGAHERALREAPALAAALADRSEALRRAGRPTPVHVRPGAPLAFHHPQGSDGPRYRLEPDGRAYAEVAGGRRHRHDDLLRRLHDEPACFSSSALLRPIMQDTLLPTAAYVGGTTEVDYFAQLAPLYEHFDLEMPLILARASFRCLDPRWSRMLQRWRLAGADCESPRDDVLRRAATVAGDGEQVLAQLLLAPFLTRLDEIAPKLVQVDSDLQSAIDKTRSTVEMAIGKLGGRYDRACRRRNERLVADVATLTTALFPEGQPQERYYGLSALAGRIEDTALVAQAIAAVAPFADATPRDLHLHTEGPA